MTLTIDRTSTLTTDHTASSYGQPVLVRDGIAYGPMDLVDEGIFGQTPASEIVLRYARKINLKAAMTHGALIDREEIALVEKFLVLAGLAND